MCIRVCVRASAREKEGIFEYFMKGESEMGMYEHYRSIQTLIPEASHFSKSEPLEFPVERETVQRHCATV